MVKYQTDILIIGGGAAGMSAAVCAFENSDLRVLIVDDNPHLGGQIWRAELGKVKSPKAKKLINKIELNGIKILNDVHIFARSDEKSLLAEDENGTIQLCFEKLILATGARERFLPFPNWTLPNVFGAGGLQALVKSGLSVENKRVVVAGTGALLLAVAEYLKSKGARVLMIVEQASRTKILKFGFSLWRKPTKLIQAISLRTKLLGTPYLTDAYVTSVEGTENLEVVKLIKNNKNRQVECDLLACGFHLVGNTEIASLIECEVENGHVLVNEFQETSVKDVFCAGEPTGIGGVELSMVEGNVAGLAAINKQEKARKFFSRKRRLSAFAIALNETFALREDLKSLCDEKTIVCRCEDVRFESLKNFRSLREAKLQARCGMGACQGRICGAATEFLFGWENTSIRPPVFPVKLENLVN